ncbi:MAG: helix-turn-helix transcriptional regulator [Elainellaceae cyanobacterium]
MTITISQHAYQELMTEAEAVESPRSGNVFERAWRYPSQLGQGYYCAFELREGVELSIARYRLHEDVAIRLPERDHPLEYTFKVAEGVGRSPTSLDGTYFIYGSGLAPVETYCDRAIAPTLEINVHLDPAVFQSFVGVPSELASEKLAHLIRAADQPYYQRSASMTPSMQMVVHQLLHCPFQGVAQKIYLESKVWELMALLMEQEQNLHQMACSQPVLKPDDIDRIHQAREILVKQMDQPPSLLDLARQVGLNDCTLKRGFRQVFGKTAFGYLHDYRLEQARQLLQKRHLNVSEVARTIGFANRSYFAAAFRKKYGVSPKHYLTRHKNSV